MSLFGKQAERPSPIAPSYVAGQGAYGIAELIRLLKAIPVGQHPSLVVQVIKSTLESVGVQSSAVIEDAIVRESGIRDQVAMLESQIVDLTQEIQARQDRIAFLHVELSETTDARNRLAHSDPGAAEPTTMGPDPFQVLPPSDVLADIDNAAFEEQPKRPTLPPPVPPPRRKTSVSQLPAPTSRR